MALERAWARRFFNRCSRRGTAGLLGSACTAWRSPTLLSECLPRLCCAAPQRTTACWPAAAPTPRSGCGTCARGARPALSPSTSPAPSACSRLVCRQLCRAHAPAAGCLAGAAGAAAAAAARAARPTSLLTRIQASSFPPGAPLCSCPPYHSHVFPVGGLDARLDCRYLVAGCFDGSVYVLDARTMQASGRCWVRSG